MKAPLSGIVPPIVTPLRGRDALDVAGLERVLEHIIAGGVSGLFILGTTGEGPSLSYRLRREFIERVCRQVNGRVAVLVGITDTAFMESLHLARHAAQWGADAVVAAPPYYLPEAQPELLEWIQHLVPELPLPLFLYNMPSLTKVSFELETVRRAMDHPRVLGLKDSSGNMIYFHRLIGLLSYRPDWSLLIGPEELLLDATLAGGHGGVNGGAQVDPQLLVGLYDATIRGDNATVERLQERLTKLGEIYRVGRHASTVIKGVKCALNLLGVCAGEMAEPFRAFKEPERRKVERTLIELGLLPDPN